MSKQTEEDIDNIKKFYEVPSKDKAKNIYSGNSVSSNRQNNITNISGNVIKIGNNKRQIVEEILRDNTVDVNNYEADRSVLSRPYSPPINNNVK